MPRATATATPPTTGTLNEAQVVALAQLVRGQLGGGSYRTITREQLNAEPLLSGGVRPPIAFRDGEAYTDIPNMFWDAERSMTTTASRVDGPWGERLRAVTDSIEGDNTDPDYVLIHRDLGQALFLYVSVVDGFTFVSAHRVADYYIASTFWVYHDDRWKMVGYTNGGTPLSSTRSWNSELTRRVFDSYVEACTYNVDDYNSEAVEYDEDDEPIPSEGVFAGTDFARELRSRFITTDCTLAHAVAITATLCSEHQMERFGLPSTLIWEQDLGVSSDAP